MISSYGQWLRTRRDTIATNSAADMHNQRPTRSILRIILH